LSPKLPSLNFSGTMSVKSEICKLNTDSGKMFAMDKSKK
jgi:hypothetical protein